MNKIGIIGHGKMGSGIFNYLVDFDFGLVLLVGPEADTDKIQKQLHRRIRRSIDAGIMEEKQGKRIKQTPISMDPTVLADCDLVIEAIPENLALKVKLFSDLDNIVKPACIFASNSSSINPSLLSPGNDRSDKTIGLHFFYPVAMKNIVEFTTSLHTSANTVEVVSSFLRKIHKDFLLLDDQNSFLLNRIFLDFQNEAYHLVTQEKCSMEQMDQLVREHFFPFGVFDFCDSVGIDTMLNSVKNYVENYSDTAYYQPFVSKLENLCHQGRYGLKTNAGFYDYPSANTATLHPEALSEIVSHLRLTWLNSVRRFAASANLPADQMNDALVAYFDIDKGPL